MGILLVEDMSEVVGFVKRRVTAWSLVFLILVTLAFTLPAVGQTKNDFPSASATAPLQNKAEQWTGIYGPAVRAPVPGGGTRISNDEIDSVVLAYLQPWALARREATDFELEDLGQICKPVGIFRGAAADAGFELLATDGTFVLNATGDTYHAVRRIYLNRPHLKSNPLLWFGDSVGHWEGDTLVVDTVGFNDQTWLSEDRTRHSEALHVVERWRFVANGTYLEHTATVDDLLALTSSYTLTAYYQKLRPDAPRAEKVCEDTPEARRAWVKLHNRAVKEREENQKELLRSGDKEPSVK